MDLKTKLKDVWKDPVGRNILQNLEHHFWNDNGKFPRMITKNLPLYKLDEYAGAGFAVRVLELIDQMQEVLPLEKGNDEKTWWKEAVVYQLFIPSFMDADHDGYGDFRGVLQRLPYLAQLGVNTLWLSPFIYIGNKTGRAALDFQSPFPDFGSLEDFEMLIEAAHEQKMRVIIGLDISATSEKHVWFQNALKDPESKWFNYYHLKKGTKQRLPNNWGRSENGWKWFEDIQSWGLSFLGPDRMELNWGNPEVRKEMTDVLQFWADKGVDGFCLGSFSFIAKKSFDNGMPSMVEAAGTIGYEHCVYTPIAQTYLKELRENIVGHPSLLLVGEGNNMSSSLARVYTSNPGQGIDSVLDFSHLIGPKHPKNREERERISLQSIKSYYLDWMEQYGKDCWMPLVLGNSKFPRLLSRLHVNPVYKNILAKMLATMLLTLRGIPMIYQGEELGLTNLKIEGKNKTDVNSKITLHKKVVQEDFSYSRAPMPWNSGVNGGFTGATPWIQTLDSVNFINVRNQMEDAKSVYNYYRKMIRVHKLNDVLMYGEFNLVFTLNKNLFCYFRILEDERWYIELNLTDKVVRRERGLTFNMKLEVSNYDVVAKNLRPYEANVYRCE